MSDITIVELPKLYENMDEATVGPWQVQLGQHLKAGQFIVELITDKTVVEFESPVDGTLLRIYATEKSTVPHGYALCAIGPEDAQAPDLTAANEAKVAAHLKASTGGIDVSSLGILTPTPTAAAPDTPAKPAFRAAPAAKVFARQHHVELADVARFTGRDMIHRKDVEDFLAAQNKPKTEPEPMPAPAPISAPNPAPAPASAPSGARVALVTGATGGIGSAIVRRLAQDGVAVAIHCHRDLDAANRLRDELAAQGAACQVFQADLDATPEAPQQLADAVLAAFGRLDILVNNAGRLADSTISFMSDEQWNGVLSLCLTVPFRLMRACAMNMARQNWGRIVNIASDAGRMGSANRANYASAKEGLCGLTRSAALELAGRGVRVNAVSPGFVESPMTADIPDRKRQELLRTIPVRRFGQPAEVAELVAFLASDKADYITGQVISINGGLCM